MRTIWKIIGRICYFFAWPGLYIFLNNSNRTRVLVRFDNKILVLKDWLGDGSWKLPGGGIHSGEPALDSAVRELKEETGIEARAKDLKLLGKFKSSDQGINVNLVIFELNLKSELELQPHNFEITDISWQSTANLQKNLKISSNTRSILEKFKA